MIRTKTWPNNMCSTLYWGQLLVGRERTQKQYEVFFTVLNSVTDEQFASSVSAISEHLDESRDES